MQYTDIFVESIQNKLVHMIRLKSEQFFVYKKKKSNRLKYSKFSPEQLIVLRRNIWFSAVEISN